MVKEERYREHMRCRKPGGCNLGWATGDLQRFIRNDPNNRSRSHSQADFQVSRTARYSAQAALSSALSSTRVSGVSRAAKHHRKH